MNKRKERSFSSVDEILKAYMPKHKSSTESRVADDPEQTGRMFAEELMKTIRGEMTKRLRRK